MRANHPIFPAALLTSNPAGPVLPITAGTRRPSLSQGVPAGPSLPPTQAGAASLPAQHRPLVLLPYPSPGRTGRRSSRFAHHPRSCPRAGERPGGGQDRGASLAAYGEVPHAHHPRPLSRLRRSPTAREAQPTNMRQRDVSIPRRNQSGQRFGCLGDLCLLASIRSPPS